jgi:hypothetical protein
MGKHNGKSRSQGGTKVGSALVGRHKVRRVRAGRVSVWLFWCAACRWAAEQQLSGRVRPVYASRRQQLRGGFAAAADVARQPVMRSQLG